MKAGQRKIWLVVVAVGLAVGLFFYFKPAIDCKKAYASLTKDGVLFITVAFGYKDARPMRFVGDRYERAAFIDVLLVPCDVGEVLCGFAVDPGNPEFFSKKLIWFDEKERVVQIQVLGSSVGPDDEWNRDSALQKWHSERTRKLFRRALAKSDVVFYNGHSRIGGGPDFFPPLIHKSGGIKYDYYQQERPGLKDLLDDLAAAKGARQPRLLGLFSCASSKHFMDSLMNAKPKLGVIASEALLYQSDAMHNMVAALESILRGECTDDFNDRLRSHDSMVGSEIVGFF